MGRRKQQPPEPLELEIMPAHEVVKRQYIVTAYSNLPADHLKDEPDIRVEIESASACSASVAMMRQYPRKSYYYVKIVDVTPAKTRTRHTVDEIAEEGEIEE